MRLISKTCLCLIFLFAANTINAQNNTIKIVFSPVFGLQAFDLVDSTYSAERWIDLKIETLKFYVSNIRFLKNHKVVFKEQNSVHLIDGSDAGSMTFDIHTPVEFDYDVLKFDLGIDSLTNVSGVMGGDLDPTNGMYWTWQSGYINFKLEGQSESSPARNNEYQFHLGGYQSPFYCLLTIKLLLQETNNVHINLDIENILNEIDLSKLHHVMSPGENALLLSSIVAESFRIREE